MKSALFATIVVASFASIGVAQTPSQTVKVNPYNFNRAESDVYFAKLVKDGGGTGKFSITDSQPRSKNSRSSG
jgi:hypothetical protein